MIAFGGIWFFECPEAHDIRAFGQAFGSHMEPVPTGSLIPRGTICWTSDRAVPGPECDSLYLSDDLAVICDGRFDNRNDIAALLYKGDRCRLSNAALIAHCYEKWSTDLFKHLIGDYAAFIWDAQRETVFLVRDPFGTRPLFFYRDQQKIAWSTDIAPLAALLDSRNIDKEYIAGFIILSAASTRTPYTQISAVEPGTVVCLGRNQSVKRFWSLAAEQQLSGRNDGEYEAMFRSLFVQAVARRLQPAESIICELSGGLDSSSIACVAAELVKDGGFEDKQLHTVTHAYDRSFTADERRFTVHVENKYGLSHEHLLESACPLLTSFEAAYNAQAPSPVLCFDSMFAALREIVRRTAVNVILSGYGGDNVLLNELSFFPVLADAALAGKWSTFIKLLRGWRLVTKVPYATLLRESLLWPLLPSRWQAATPVDELKIPDWIDRSFAEETHCQEKTLLPLGHTSVKSRARKRQHALISNAISNASCCHYRAAVSIDVTYPFLDRDLVEFLLKVPIEQLQRPGELRSLHRRALGDLLPEPVLKRKGKKGPDEAILRAIAENWDVVQDLLKTSQVCQRGYVDPGRFEHALVLARNGVASHLAFLLRALSLEIWLRAREKRPATEVLNGRRRAAVWSAMIGKDQKFLYRSATPMLMAFSRRKENHEKSTPNPV
jgi:asparagine synthase (glutamine-hydrolysing)